MLRRAALCVILAAAGDAQREPEAPNFVLVVSEGSFGDAPTAYYDLFRVEEGRIAEHWDVIETIPPREAWKNDNGKF